MKSVSVLEVPDSIALRFIVLKVALEVEAIGIHPSAVVQLAVVPVAAHLHACLLELVCAVAVFVAVLPPA